VTSALRVRLSAALAAVSVLSQTKPIAVLLCPSKRPIMVLNAALPSPGGLLRSNRPTASSARTIGALRLMPSRYRAISSGPTRVRRTLSITVRGVSSSTLADSRHSVRSGSSWAASTVPPKRRP